MKWENFTVIQDMAIPAILQTNHDVIISAGTASGKTEAAFLPILTAVEEEAKKHLKVLYISPLKALINNQFNRIEELCEYMDIAIHKWHGDVGQHQKKKFIEEPKGILQITPESIESLFINRPGSISAIFKELDYVVIDEIHSFIDGERGVQLRSLLSRIEEVATTRPRIVGLSATINNFDLVKRWVHHNSPDMVDIIEDKHSDKKLLYYLMYFETDEDKKKTIELFEDIRELTRDDKSIIFCNARGTVEEVTVMLNRLAELEHIGETYYPHHSSIDKKEREYVEKIMSETTYPKSVVATSSLELGIDIGDVDLVIQIDSTFSVSSLKQRLGRSGRKKDASQILQLYCTKEDSLLQSLAVMELVLDKWVEPAQGYPLPYDIAVHQMMSICAEKNGVTADELLNMLGRNGIFYTLNREKLRLLIEHLVELDVLERLIGKGELIVGLEGERILRSREFYSVFSTTEDYEVVEGARKIGRIDKTPFLHEGDNIILAGKLWTISSLDNKVNKAHVQKAVNAKPPAYMGDGGKIHKKIGEKAMAILCSEEAFEYIDPKANEKLTDLRKAYLMYSVAPTERVVWKQRDEYLLETFTSTQIATTLVWMMRMLGVEVVRRDLLGRILFKTNQDVNELFRLLKKNLWLEQDLVERKKEIESFQTKYSVYLPEFLQDEMHIAHEFDLAGTMEYLHAFEWKVIAQQ